MSAAKSTLKWVLRFAALYVLFIVCFMLGAMTLSGVIPATAISEPGLVSLTAGLLIVTLADVIVIVCLILTSRWHGWRLALTLALAYYGVVTFLMQIETWYFLSAITVPPPVLPRLFLMGVPTALAFIPVAVWILGKGTAETDASPNLALRMPIQQWAWKLAVLVVAYITLYWTAGYFIAWQNPELRAFYGQPGDPLPFLTSTVDTVHRYPMLFPFQALRALLWVLFALPVIRGSKLNAWWTALLVGVFFSVPQNIGHIVANPFLPLASVRLSHLLETVSSTFVFGLVVVWFLHREHRSVGDLFGRHRAATISLG